MLVIPGRPGRDTCDGLTRRELLPSTLTQPLVKVSGSASSADTLALHDRKDMLFFNTVQTSTNKALKQAGAALDDVDLFEYHDVFSIFAALQLEAAGFAGRGEGWKLAAAKGRPASPEKSGRGSRGTVGSTGLI